MPIKRDRKEYNKQYRIKNKKHLKQYYKEYRDSHKEERKEYRDSHKEKSKQYRIDNKEKIKNSIIKRKYGIPLEEYNIIFNKQEGRCAICGIHQNEMSKTLHIDHDHKTGRIRGLLCGNCNLLIGNADDNITTLESAINYLRQN